MGEMAEYLLNGDDDMITGEYIGPGDGFPRTFTKTKWSGRYIDKSVARILEDERLPGATSRVIQDGYQIIFKGNKFTFFPKHCKMSWKGRWYVHNKGQEVEKMLELTGYYKKHAVEPVIAPVAINNGTQQCIDHILKKVATIEKVKGNNAVATILKTVAVELQQYL